LAFDENNIVIQITLGTDEDRPLGDEITTDEELVEVPQLWILLLQYFLLKP